MGDRVVIRPEGARVVVRDQGAARRVVAVASSRVVVRAQGPTGPAGGGASSYVHTQSTPSAAWNVNHGLGYRPSVELLDAAGTEIDAAVTHPNVNQTTVTFNTATTGTARCQ